MKKRWFLSFSMLTIAGVVNAVGITCFLSPVKLFDSGASGTSMLLSQLTPLSLSIFLLLINLPLFLFGLKVQGKWFTIYSSYSVAIYSLVALLITDVLPIDVSQISPIAGDDLLLCALFGGFLSGVGSGIAIRFGGAMDGVEVLAIIFAKRIGITVGSFMMIFNVILYTLCGILLNGGWELPLYSIITYLVGLKTIDYVVEGIDRAKAIHIITNKEDDVCKMLSNHFGQGITIMQGMGWYSHSNKTVIYFILNRFQIPKMKEIVLSIDEGAYISINDVTDIFKGSSKRG